MTAGGFDVATCRERARRRLALETPRAVTLDGSDLATLAAALTVFLEDGERGAAGPSERYDHAREVERVAGVLGVTLGRWSSATVVRSDR